MKVQKSQMLIFVLLICIMLCQPAFCTDNRIVIHCDSDRGKINEKIFGNNIIAYDPTTYENWIKDYYGYSDYGAGIWDPRLKQSVKEVIDLAKETGISVARFPGGCGSHHYNWKKAIGKDRKHFLYGLDEFLKTCEEMGAEPVITLSYFTSDEFNAAELVEYLNAPSDPSHKWAMRRAENGHSKPYNVRYFEIGNEVWHGDHQKIKRVLPKDYAFRYLKYYAKMKAVDPSINIGVVLYNSEWNKVVMRIIKDKMDFGIIHIYPYPDGGEEIVKKEPKDIFRETLGSVLLREEKMLKETVRIIKEVSKKDVPLAITEYNGGFCQDEPVPYRHCLGTALLNAELLRIFMKPEYKILMANYWDFVNEYWGMVANGFDGNYTDLYNPYYKRPNYYVFQLYHEHFGEILIDAEVSDTFYNSGLHRIPYLSVNASKSKNGKKLYLMVVNKNMTDSITVKMQTRDFKAVKMDAWILNGLGVQATNERNHGNVALKHVEIKNKYPEREDGLEFIFEPHSLTAIEFSRVENEK